MAKPRSNGTGVGTSSTRGTLTRRGHAERLCPATRALSDVLAERGPLTGPITDAGTKALLAVRGEDSNGVHGRL